MKWNRLKLRNQIKRIFPRTEWRKSILRSFSTRVFAFAIDIDVNTEKLSSKFIASVAQLVEHHLAKVDVEGSSPFARSSKILR